MSILSPKTALKTVLAMVSLIGTGVGQRQKRTLETLVMVQLCWRGYERTERRGYWRYPLEILCRCTLHFWHLKHMETQLWTSEFMLGHTKQSTMNLTVARILGWNCCKADEYIDPTNFWNMSDWQRTRQEWQNKVVVSKGQILLCRIVIGNHMVDAGSWNPGTGS